jgi:type I restriction enzyme M protein
VVGSGRSASKYKMDLLPPALVVDRYFPERRRELDRLAAAVDVAAQAIADYVALEGEEGGRIEELVNEKGVVTQKDASAQIDELKNEPARADELEAAERCLALLKDEASARARLKAAEKRLNEDVVRQYGELSEAEVKSLVVEDRWFADLSRALGARVELLATGLADRVAVLESRYHEPLPSLLKTVAELDERTAAHLDAIGRGADEG